MTNSDIVVTETDPDFASIKSFLKSQNQESVATYVDARDEMYAFAMANCPIPSVARCGYFMAGLQAHITLRQIYDWCFKDDDSKKKILDFASGYGRGTRFLVSDFKEHEIWASDILEGAMAFQSNYLKTKTLISTTKPSDFKPEIKFDFIWVASLFTHLPKHTFFEWLEKLYSLLTPKGVLAFSIHDVQHMPPDTPMPDDGFFFQPCTEIPTLDTADYGATVVTPQFMTFAIEKITNNMEYKHIPRALNFSQDLYIISKTNLPYSYFSFKHPPYGFLDHCILVDDETLLLSGWSLDYTKGHTIKVVEIFYNGKFVGSVVPLLERPDIVEHSKRYIGERSHEFLRSGWRLQIKLPNPLKPFHDIIQAKAISTSGFEFVIRSCKMNTILTIAA